MASKEFIHQRIRVYAGENFNPSIDNQIGEMLRSQFNIHLPQRRTIDESLAASISDHEIVSLILEYRTLD